jgi:CxxC motif-containing protein (DUF1111 family)
VNKNNLLLLSVGAMLAGSVMLHARVPQGFGGPMQAKDPGIRTGIAGAGDPYPEMTTGQMSIFNPGKEEFTQEETVAEGLGPTMNLDSCAGCHGYPAVGGSSPLVNPQVAFATKNGANNVLPAFITSGGPVREVRFVRAANGAPDGGVHALFTIAGRADAPGCQLAQPDFAGAVASNNAVFRIPTPTFGLGLVEQIPDSTIMANQAANAAQKAALGIFGRPNIVLAGNTISGQPNRNGNDGTLARFGWKAQNKSLLLFTGEAYNVEMGISNELFQTERDETPGCQLMTTPNDTTDADSTDYLSAATDMEKFAFFMRFLAPPVPSPNTPGGAVSIALGNKLFTSVGCALCHTPTLQTGNATYATFRNEPVNLYSDLLVHDMGPNLADGVTQGQAGPQEFRTAPLWGLGQRVFFLHDGRTNDLLAAIQAHQSGSAAGNNASEANAVIDNFNRLPEVMKQNLLNFLRSL